jgi:hypothetical protein
MGLYLSILRYLSFKVLLVVFTVLLRLQGLPRQASDSCHRFVRSHCHSTPFDLSHHSHGTWLSYSDSEITSPRRNSISPPQPVSSSYDKVKSNVGYCADSFCRAGTGRAPCSIKVVVRLHSSHHSLLPP